ncbi:GH116 family glycosyl hydrolase [Flavivirga spongiicola]|uniref:Non-lysosomal glucosylceramidase n=1 Tax=Flavivirga spongiicola TaxID=421621 RepID=A0ABU7XUH7_9FLAO|nr:GH116 family glycosyl hydrolase [Flavivirga sp. MEBiC05379]MDO5979084.1 GH116 family glycosyl hydrolase [Flavivirga sp. MEBiC05379]
MKKIGVLVLICLMSKIGISQNEFGHIIKENKNLSKEWKASLYKKGEQKIYRDEELNTIGMPCGGIASGQLYVRGDGTLANWWIANNAYNTGYGIDHLLNFETAQGPWKVCYQTFEPFSYFEQGFEIEIQSGNKLYTRKLDKTGFNNIGFIGEYPIAKVLYEDKKKALPVDITMEVFSPFIPLNAKESATPGTILKFKIKNRSSKELKVSLSGYLQNMVMADLKNDIKGTIRNQVKQTEEMQTLYMDYIPENQAESFHPYFGNMSLSLIQSTGIVFTDKIKKEKEISLKAIQEELIGSVQSNISLNKGEEKEITFLLTWYFPNRPKQYGNGGNWNKAIPTKGESIGNMYANWFNSSIDVATYLKNDIQRLSQNTYKFHDSWYNKSTLPYWLRQRIMMPVSTLATETCQWWANDKFWAWEGVGSCVGTCTHVYNYEQAIARLFPELERNIREKTDLETSFGDDGGIQARNGWGSVLLDGHIGAILKSYREYLISKDQLFLSRNWSKIKKAMEFAFKHDGNLNGLIEGKQSNTYDISFEGANSYVGGLYLASLRAAEEMALIMDDTDFATKCHDIFKSGKELSVKKIWNGEYFFQDVDLEKHPKFQYANGCLSDQLFGQTWAHQLNLGYIYPKEYVDKALQSIWKYNWTQDIGPHVSKFKPERNYANAGEPGLLNCTWPISEHLNENAVRYRNEVWTGIEYQVATNMIYDDMIEEGLSIVKGVHERYRPEKHNPWNEIECGDHYARALASWGILIALEDYFYDGPKGILGFAPKIQKSNFESYFTTAKGWGNISQTRKNNVQHNNLNLVNGKLELSQLNFEIPSNKHVKSVFLLKNNKKIAINFKQKEKTVQINFKRTPFYSADILETKIEY